MHPLLLHKRQIRTLSVILTFAGMEVYTLTDPCDPCYNNPYVKGDMTETQKGVRAAKPLAKGDVAGIYQGRLITRVRDSSHGCVTHHTGA